jgi:glucose-6-phosphate isomerase
MARFNEYAAFGKLQELARSPVDLTRDGVMTPERLGKYRAEACGWRLLYGTERVSDPVLGALEELAKQADAWRWMERMQGGEVINRIEGYPSEEREVLHTAMRDLFDAPRQEPAAKKAAAQARAEQEKLRTFLEKNRGRFTDVIQIGIGGSDLGPRAFAIALQAYAQEGRRAHFFSNVDPDDGARVLRSIDPKKTLVVVVSKSGTTLETLTNETIARNYFEKAGVNPRDHFVAVTGEKSPMDNPARYLASFYMWDYVGGRYSVTSMVGAVVLAFLLGHEAQMEILKGAHDMDRTACAARLSDNLPLLGALLGIWNRNFLGLPTVAVLPYSQALERFPAHLQQCNMESNGKHIDRQGRQVNWATGPVVWGEPGTNGQHSFYQLIHQGTDTIPCEFVGLRQSQYGEDLLVEGTNSQEKLLANLFAQSLALATGKQDKNPNKQFAGNRPNSLMLAQRLTPYSLGALMSYYEHKIAFQGFIWGINSFDQEGVQLGKVLAKQFVEQFAAVRKGEKPASWPIGESYLRQLHE